MSGSTMRSRKKSKHTLKQMKMRTYTSNLYDCFQDWKSNTKREIQSITNLFQKTRKSSTKQSNLTLTGTWKRTTNKTHSVKKEGNNKDQSRNKQNKVLEKDRKDQWIPELVIWKDKQDWQHFHQIHQEKKREDSNT